MSWLLNGVSLPAPVGDYIADWDRTKGRSDREAKLGKPLWAGTHDFGPAPGPGVCPVVVWEKWICVVLGGKEPYDVQGVAVTSPHFAAILQEHFSGHRAPTSGGH